MEPSKKISLRPSLLRVPTEEKKSSGTEWTPRPFMDRPYRQIEEEKLFQGVQRGSEEQPSEIQSFSKVSSLVSTSQVECNIISAAVSESGNKEICSSVKSDFIFGEKLAERALNFDSDPETSYQTMPPELKIHDPTLENVKKIEPMKVNKWSDFPKSPVFIPKSTPPESRVETMILTGKEVSPEENIVETQGKLYVFDTSKEIWEDLGRGILQLKDKKCEDGLHSRIVIRTPGSVKIVVNTPVWPGMKMEHPDKKTVDFSAVDADGVIRYFSFITKPYAAWQLTRFLGYRIQSLEKKKNEVPDLQKPGCSGIKRDRSESGDHQHLSK